MSSSSPKSIPASLCVGSFILLAAITSCTASGGTTIAGHAIPAPQGFKLEVPSDDFACFAPNSTQSALGVSFCARPLLKQGVLASNTFAVDSYPLGDRAVEVRGLASDGSKNADTIYFILETDDLLLIAECAGSERGSDLLDKCLPQRTAFNDWLRAILGLQARKMGE